jgi:hypothetical protein
VGITENVLPAVLAGMLAVHLKKGNALVYSLDRFLYVG